MCRSRGLRVSLRVDWTPAVFQLMCDGSVAERYEEEEQERREERKSCGVKERTVCLNHSSAGTNCARDRHQHHPPPPFVWFSCSAVMEVTWRLTMPFDRREHRYCSHVIWANPLLLLILLLSYKMWGVWPKSAKCKKETKREEMRKEEGGRGGMLKHGSDVGKLACQLVTVR